MTFGSKSHTHSASVHLLGCIWRRKLRRLLSSQVLAAVDEVTEQLQACGAAKTTVMQDYAIKCYTQILTPLQARLPMSHTVP